MISKQAKQQPPAANHLIQGLDTITTLKSAAQECFIFTNSSDEWFIDCHNENVMQEHALVSALK